MSGKGGKYLQTENIHWEGEEGKRKGRKYLEEKKTKKEKETNIFGEAEYSVCGGEGKWRRKRRKIYGEGKYFVS